MKVDWLIVGAGYSACVLAKENRDRYNFYLKESEKLNGTVIFARRLAEYKYYDMNQVALQAISLFEKEVIGK